MSKGAKSKAGKGAKDKGSKPSKPGKAARKKLPKDKCCVTKPRCHRCPIRMLAEGRMPEGYTVKKRRLVKTG